MSFLSPASDRFLLCTVDFSMHPGFPSSFFFFDFSSIYHSFLSPHSSSSPPPGPLYSRWVLDKKRELYICYFTSWYQTSPTQAVRIQQVIIEVKRWSEARYLQLVAVGDEALLQSITPAPPPLWCPGSPRGQPFWPSGELPIFLSDPPGAGSPPAGIFSAGQSASSALNFHHWMTLFHWWQSRGRLWVPAQLREETARSSAAVQASLFGP